MEVLVAMAITSIVGLVISSLVMFTSAGARSLYRTTDDYEAVRLPATLILQDSRGAGEWELCSQTNLRLKLYKNATPYTVEYQLRSQGGGRFSLVRVTTDGGTSVEETLATDLLSPPNSRFGCTNSISPPLLNVEYVLSKAVPAGQPKIEERGLAYLRGW